MLSYMQTHGTYLNGKKIQPNKPKQLAKGSSLTFGTSTRCYKLLSESSGAGKGLIICKPHQPTSAEMHGKYCSCGMALIQTMDSSG